MRKITLMALLFVAGSSTMIVSCKKKTNDPQQTIPPPTGVFTESFSAKIDGATYTAATITVTHSGGGLNITAVSNGKTMSIQFEDNLTAGSHNLPGAMYDENGTLYGMTDGTLVITSHDTGLNRITGTFTMHVSDFNVTTKTITNGAFSVEYE